MNKNSISLAVALVLLPAVALAQANPGGSNSNATANTASNSSSSSAGGTGIGGAGGAASVSGVSAGGGSVSGVNAGGAQVGATTAGNVQSYSPTTNNNYITPDVQTVNQNLNGTTTQNVNQNGTLTTNGTSTVNGHTSSDNKQTTTNIIAGTQGVHYSGTQTIKNVPSLGNINLTSSNDTCHGSTSGGIAGPGFGLQLGTTYTDNNCILLKQSRELFNMGLHAAAFALLCTADPIRASIKASWKNDQDYLCPADQEGRTQARNAGQSTVAYIPPAPNTVTVGVVAMPVQPAASGAVVAAHGQVTFVKPGWETANLADKAVFNRMMASN